MRRKRRRLRKKSTRIRAQRAYPQPIARAKTRLRSHFALDYLMQTIQDNRTFDPQLRKNRRLDGTLATHTLTDQKGSYQGRNQTKAKLSFTDPKRTITCIRRRRRREALFSRRKVGKGIRVSKIRRTTPESQIKCR